MHNTAHLTQDLFKPLKKPLPDAKELSFLEKVRDVRLSLLKGMPTLVVVDFIQDFDMVFKNFSPAMKIYAKNGLLSIKTLDTVCVEDLESNIIELCGED